MRHPKTRSVPLWHDANNASWQIMPNSDNSLVVRDCGVEFFLHAEGANIARYVQTALSERWVTGIFHSALALPRESPQYKRRIVFDIGANAGYYGMLSLALGAHVVMFDLQPTCWDIIRAAIDRNHFGLGAQLVQHGDESRESESSTAVFLDQTIDD
jgi:ribosomal protein L11 methylase PrmA